MICTPAIIYLVFGIIQILVDLNKGLNNTAFVKFVVVVFFTTLLNLFCSLGLELVSWVIVILPFIFTGFVVASVLYRLGLDTSNGNVPQKHIKPQRQYISFSEYYDTYIA
jgi:hypothetical protein